MSPRKLDKKDVNTSKKYVFAAAAVTLFGAVYAAIKFKKTPVPVGDMNSVPTVGVQSRH